MAYQIPRPGDHPLAERARAPRLLEASMAQQAQANALRQGKEQKKANRLGAAVSLIGSAGGKGGWMKGLQSFLGGAEGEDGLTGSEMGVDISTDIMNEDGGDDTISALTGMASLAAGSPIGLLSLAKLFS